MLTIAFFSSFSYSVAAAAADSCSPPPQTSIQGKAASLFSIKISIHKRSALRRSIIIEEREREREERREKEDEVECA